MAEDSVAAINNGVQELRIGMQSGSGETSFSENSGQALHLLKSVDAPLWDAIRSLPRLPDLAGSRALRIADLGCAIGENTVFAVDRIIASIYALFEAHSATPPREVQAFFNDLPANDFNNLFRSFPPYTGTADAGGRHYFVAGVPGSFYGRLFPSESIHAFTCFTALHWMAQIPPEIEDKDSPAFNKGHIWYEQSSLAVRKAYSREYVRSLKLFLRARAEELVSGGMLIANIFATPGKLEDERKIPSSLTYTMDKSMQELVAEGIVDEDVADMFNVPQRLPCLEEVSSAVEACPGLFEVKVLQLSDVVHSYPKELRDELLADGKLCAKTINNLSKSLFFSLVEAHLGLEKAELLFQRNAKFIEQDPWMAVEGLFLTFVLLVLVKT